MFLIQKIEEFMMTHNDSRHAVGEFILHEKDNVYKYTIHDIAQYSFTSKSTVVRFAQALGYKGWKEFLKDFIDEVKYEESHQGDTDANYPFKQGDSAKQIVQNMKQLQMESIQDTADLMDLNMLQKAVDTLYDANRIVIFGLSPNIFLGDLFRRKMNSIGTYINIAKADEMGMTASALKEGDCVIMISYSGNNDLTEPMRYLPILLENKVSVIGITSAGDNYIRKNVSCVLTMSSKERLYTKISNFATEESLQFIFNCLFSCYFERHYQEYSLAKLKHSKDLESCRHAVLSQMKDEDID